VRAGSSSGRRRLVIVSARAVTAGLVAAVVSGAPSTAHAFWTRRDPLEATLAAGSLLMPRSARRGALILAAVPVHLALSVGWAQVLARTLPHGGGPCGAGPGGRGSPCWTWALSVDATRASVPFPWCRRSRTTSRSALWPARFSDGGGCPVLRGMPVPRALTEPRRRADDVGASVLVPAPPEEVSPSSSTWRTTGWSQIVMSRCSTSTARRADARADACASAGRSGSAARPRPALSWLSPRASWADRRSSARAPAARCAGSCVSGPHLVGGYGRRWCGRASAKPSQRGS